MCTCFPSLPLAVVSAQQCYTTSTTCTSTSFNIPSTRPAGPSACCVNGVGVSYKLSTTGPCTACVGKCCLLRVRSQPSASVPPPATVFGFFSNQTSSLPITSISHREGSQLSLFFGYVNGTFSANQLASFTVADSKFAPHWCARRSFDCVSLQILLDTSKPLLLML